MDRLRVLAGTFGYFRRPDALEAGFDDKAINREIRAKRWVRIRRGAYTFSDLWSAQDEVERHRARARAVVDRLGPGVALSHTSAAIEHGLAVWDADLSRVHVTRLDGGAGRTEAGVVHHEGFCVDEDLVEREDGLLIVKPARAALEHACLVSSESAVVTLDSGLYKRAFERVDMEEAFAVMRSWPSSQRLQIVVRFADGRAESAGESRSRWLCYRHRLPAPELQFEVYDDSGRLIGITDMAWPERKLLGEFDGKVKYGRLLRPGEEPGDAVFREKVREDALRAAVQYAMVRLIWADLYRGAETAARIRRLMSPC
jgi:hypothetical protein